MEPLSALGVASGVIAILQMTGTLISQGYIYIGALKDAPKELNSLVQELMSLSGILSALKVQLEIAQSTQNNTQLSALGLLNMPGGPLESCKNILGHVEKRLKNLGDRKLGSYLVGPLKDKVTKQHIEQLERLKSIFQLALYTDQMTLSKAVENYIRATFGESKKEQQILGKHIRDIDDNVAELCRESKRRAVEGKAAEDYVRKTLDESIKEQNTTGKYVKDTSDNIAELCRETERQISEEKKKREMERYHQILRWLSTIDYQSNHQAACNLQQPGTGGWLIGGQSFREWQDTAGSVLWLHGIPGAGKTILTSTVIQNIISVHGNQPSGSIAIAYFYFDFKDHEKQKTTGMLGSLLVQILQKLQKTPIEADVLFGKHQGGTRPTLDELLELLKVVLRYFTRCFLILDALDECDELPTLLPALGQLTEAASLQHTSLLFTSRKEHDIEIAFSKHPNINPVFIQNSEVAVDVAVYVAQQMEQDEQFRKFNDNLKEDIKLALIEGARGMFRWVKCQLDAIRMLNRPKAIRDALKSLPKTLDDTYDRILLSIRLDDDKELIRRALQLVVFAIRPMSLEEVAEAVVIQAGVESLDKEVRLFEPSSLLSICPSLLILIDGKLGLAHYSVQEYLKSKRIRNGAASQFALETIKAHTEISEICLTYLGFNDFGSGPCSSKDDFDARLRFFPFLLYAAENWYRHAASDSVEKYIMNLATRFCLQITPQHISWRQVLDNKYSIKFDDFTRYYSVSTLYYPVEYNLLHTTRYLLDVGADMNHIDSIARNSLLYTATCREHEKMIEILLQHGADVNVVGGKYGTALQAAAYCGNERVVEILLQHGADVNVVGGEYGTALQAAATGGNERVVEILLRHGADVNVVGGKYGTALQAAAYCGNERVVEILLRHGADVNVVGGKYGTALQVAAYTENERLVEILLQHGADVNVVGGKYGTALQAAAYMENERVVEILLRHGADVNVVVGEYGTALQAAASMENERVLEILLGYGADVNVVGGDHGTALQAAYCGNERLVKILLRHGADVNVVGGKYGTALQAAADTENERVVEILLRHGADVNVVGGEYGTALQAATLCGNKRLVEILLRHGADVNVVGGKYGTALQAAAYCGGERVVEILLQHRADVNVVGGKYGTALQAAAYCGNERVVEILLRHGADVNVVGGWYGTALQAAALFEREGVVDILLQHGADVNVIRGDHSSVSSSPERTPKGSGCPSEASENEDDEQDSEDSEEGD